MIGHAIQNMGYFFPRTLPHLCKPQLFDELDVVC